ncbi:hypothetical protein HELRODRAFT_78131 [Helobdella robusta]|uniref:Peptidase S1 domain-containing protein n=1 Tax=Helobdella robusta TaxID=6412 RepID=T1G385_HELRO|nr:hypothetical protein HELRODRAFT_78131 [Helobdella robusta]ESO04942.1 hypothetical protein HELRODRAFT_78131 [Helobdella robusta]
MTTLKTCKRQLEELKCSEHFCGTRDKSHGNLSGYIIKGTNVLQETQWPWSASILTNKDGRPYRCGGSILSSRFILTAAHCVTTFLNTTTGPNGKDYVEVDIENIDVTFGQKSSQINKLHIHENYSDEIKYDIAVIELNSAIPFSPAVKPICLPPVDMPLNLYRLCVAIGHGLTSGGFPSRRLQQVRLMPYAASLCSFKLGNVFDPSHMLCAGTYGGVENICLGDSGGPLMCKHYEKDVWFVEGVSGFTTGSQSFVEFGVYTRVAVFKSWIDSVIGGGE